MSEWHKGQIPPAEAEGSRATLGQSLWITRSEERQTASENLLPKTYTYKSTISDLNTISERLAKAQRVNSFEVYINPI